MESGDATGDSLEMLKGLQVSSFDEEEDDFIVDDDEDDEEEEDDQEPVTLGFLEKPKNSWSLLRQNFPSKAGGVPAWLDPVNLPSGRSFVCDICEEPLQLVLQVYAPITEKESTFHRTLFVFMCTSMSCLLRDQHEQWKRKHEKASRCVKVFRCQLPCVNSFYSSEPPNYANTDKPLKDGATLCSWCGTWKGDKICSGCKIAHYCSQKHQVIHWRSGHKIECQKLSLSSQSLDSKSPNGGTISSVTQKVACNSLWPEFEIINEDESEYDTEMLTDDANENALITTARPDNIVDSRLKNVEGDDDNKSWASFQERISKAPEQILRYCRNTGAKPLWPTLSGLPSKDDIPNCSYCGGPSCYEFQVLPQLLYYFDVKNDVNSLDWATIAVYTCEASCEGSESYKEEFAWVQLSSPSTTAP